MEYRVIRSDRRSLALSLVDGEIVVRAPQSVSQGSIERFVELHSEWIEKQLQKHRRQSAAAQARPKIGEKELAAMYGEARRVIPERVAFYAPLVGVTYGRITVRCQKTRWGSCSAEGNLNFNCLLMLTPREVLDSVIVHELCHRKYMDHSREFYREVRRVFPEYDKWHGWLRENGGALMRRVVIKEEA